MLLTTFCKDILVESESSSGLIRKILPSSNKYIFPRKYALLSYWSLWVQQESALCNSNSQVKEVTVIRTTDCIVGLYAVAKCMECMTCSDV